MTAKCCALACGPQATRATANGAFGAARQHRNACLRQRACFRTSCQREAMVTQAAPPAPQRGPPVVPASWAGLAAAAALVLAAPDAQALEVGATFERSCAGCHTGGGNIIRRDATLKLEDLQKYGLADTQALYSLIYSGKGSMPGFGKDCAPRGQCTFGPRLTEEEVQGLAEYVLSNAQQGWQQQ